MAPPAAEEVTTEVVAEQAAEQAEIVPGKDLDTALEVELPVKHEEPAAVGTKSAPKPARRTRLQQAKLEVEHSADEVIVNVAANSTAITTAQAAEESHAADEVAYVTGQKGTATACETPLRTEPETASKSKRLTRNQQAKRGEEREQQPPRREPEQAISKEAVTETPTDATIEQEMGSNKHADIEVVKIEGPVPSSPTANGHSNTEGDPDAKLQEIVSPETALEDSSGRQADRFQVVDTATVNEEFTDPVDVKPSAITDAATDADIKVVGTTTASLEFATEAEPKMLCEEKPFETIMSIPTTNQVSSRCSSRSPSKSTMRIEESISAIDRLEEDIESIGTAIPDLGHSDDDKSPRGSTISRASISTREKTPSKTAAKTPTKTPVRVPSRTPAKTVSKAPSKTSGNAPVAAKVLDSKNPAAVAASFASRISSVPSANPKSGKPATTSLARASSVRTVPRKDAGKPSTETADYLASKRRPISLSFPTPPPPPKGRAPTKPTFHLSSDSVAAKLRLQKEERLKREADSKAAPRQRPISMPPLAKSTKPPTIPSFQLSSEATAARLKVQKEERLKRMEEVGGAEKPITRPFSMSTTSRSTKPITKPTFQLPGEATAARLRAQKEERLKRMAEAEAVKKAGLAVPVKKPIAHRPRDSLLVNKAPGAGIPPPTQSDASQRPTSLASVCNSISRPSASRSTSTSSANRNSVVLLADGEKSTVTPVDAAAMKAKGKQVFNRDKMEKETMERERKEKEEAAKRARAEAAERGRIASREWAARQRKKLMGAQ